MQPVQMLTPEYRSIGTLDITKDRRSLIFLNIAGIILLVVSGWIFIEVILWMRRSAFADGMMGISVGRVLDTVVLLGWVLLLSTVHVIVHEAIHGVFFWLYTRSRPRFAFRWTHAYAAAPNWYLPRNQYLVTALAPLVLITLVGLALIPVVPDSWLMGLWYVLTMNTAGSVGDMLVAGWLLRQPLTCMAQDRGDSVTLFVPDGS